MNDAFSFSISIGIIAFGIWITAGTIGTGSHWAWILIGLLPVIVGTISLSYRNSRSQSCACVEVRPTTA